MWMTPAKNEYAQSEWRILWKRGSFFSQSLNKTPVVEASPSHIWIELFQGIRQFGTFPILVKGVSVHALSIDFIHTICNQSCILPIRTEGLQQKIRIFSNLLQQMWKSFGNPSNKCERILMGFTCLSRDGSCSRPIRRCGSLKTLSHLLSELLANETIQLLRSLFYWKTGVTKRVLLIYY